MSFISQIRRNLLAIISIVIAISALSYNTYRNELTEINRNMRHAGFELLKELNELQLLIDYAHYDNSAEYGNPIQGWGHVSYISDMSQLISDEVIIGANDLKLVWGEHWDVVRKDQSANKIITAEINEMRMITHKAISKLR